ncbi:MAG: RNA polymerase subunit sigma-24, partial [Myxococcales bacterium]
MMALSLLHSLPLDAPAVGAEQALVARCRSGDPGAFRRFVELHQGLVHAFLVRLVGPGPATEDLAQEVFLRAYRAFPSYDDTRGGIS